jgi:hypothetical protein
MIIIHVITVLFGRLSLYLGTENQMVSTMALETLLAKAPQQAVNSHSEAGFQND